MSVSDFQGSFSRLKERLLQFSDSNRNTCDIEQSVELNGQQIPEYVEIIIKNDNMECDRLRLDSDFPLYDVVSFIPHTGQEITRIKQEIIDYICNN